LTDCLPEKAMAGDFNVTGLFALLFVRKNDVFFSNSALFSVWVICYLKQ